MQTAKISVLQKDDSMAYPVKHNKSWISQGENKEMKYMEDSFRQRRLCLGRSRMRISPIVSYQSTRNKGGKRPFQPTAFQRIRLNYDSSILPCLFELYTNSMETFLHVP